MKKILIILRHENSLEIVHRYLSERNMEAITVALDPVETPDNVKTALQKISLAITSGVDAVIAGTKVYDQVKLDKSEPPQRLIDFLFLLKEYGIAKKPVCLTHLAAMPEKLSKNIQQTGLNVSWTENDNLKNDGMDNIGPLLLDALKLSS